MKTLNTIILGILLTFLYSCTPTEVTEETPIVQPEVTKVLTFKETARWSDTQKLLVEDPRELSPTKDLFTWGELGKISRKEYQLKTYIEYNEKNKTFSLIYPGTLTNDSEVRFISGNFKIKSSYIETRDSEILGALVLILEDDLSSYNLKVLFIDKGIEGLTNQDKNLIQISGTYKYISPKTNPYFDKNFLLCFHTIERFSINNSSIILN